MVKRRRRRAAEVVAAGVAAAPAAAPIPASADNTDEFVAQTRKELLDALQAQLDGRAPRHHHHDPPPAAESDHNNANLLVDPYRRWHAAFFQIGPRDCPEPNADTLRRRQLEQKAQCWHVRPPWAAHEVDGLQELVKQQQQQQTDNVASIDFDSIAARLASSSKKTGRTRGPYPAHTALPRTPRECQIQWERWQGDQRGKLSKAELAELRQLVQQQQQQQQQSSPHRCDWSAVAAAMGTGRVPWECFAAHQAVTATTTIDTAWTVVEDELWLKYVAALGPRAVLERGELDHVIVRLFPTKTRFQLTQRLHHGLGNPRFVTDRWSDAEERQLAILHKVYCDETNDSAIANAHFPHRTVKSVLDKWERTLNPSYNTKPFTAAEDTRMRELMIMTHSAAAHVSWSEVARSHFPDRHPQRVQTRWHELQKE